MRLDGATRMPTRVLRQPRRALGKKPCRRASNRPSSPHQVDHFEFDVKKSRVHVVVSHLLCGNRTPACRRRGNRRSMPEFAASDRCLTARVVAGSWVTLLQHQLAAGRVQSSPGRLGGCTTRHSWCWCSFTTTPSSRSASGFGASQSFYTIQNYVVKECPYVE